MVWRVAFFAKDGVKGQDIDGTKEEAAVECVAQMLFVEDVLFFLSCVRSQRDRETDQAKGWEVWINHQSRGSGWDWSRHLYAVQKKAERRAGCAPPLEA